MPKFAKISEIVQFAVLQILKKLAILKEENKKVVIWTEFEPEPFGMQDECATDWATIPFLY